MPNGLARPADYSFFAWEWTRPHGLRLADVGTGQAYNGKDKVKT